MQQLDSESHVLNLRPYSSLKVLEAHGEKVAKELLKLNQREKSIAFSPLKSREVTTMSKLLLQRRRDIAEGPSLDSTDISPSPRGPRLADGLRKINQEPSHSDKKTDEGGGGGGGEEGGQAEKGKMITSIPSSSPLSSTPSSSSSSSSQSLPLLHVNIHPILNKNKSIRPFTSQYKSAVDKADEFQSESILNLEKIRQEEDYRHNKNSSSDIKTTSKDLTRSRSPMRGNISRFKPNPLEIIPDNAVKRVGSSTKWTLGQLKSHYVWPHNVAALSTDNNRSLQRAYPQNEGHLYRIKTSPHGSPLVEQSDSSERFSPSTKISILSPKPSITSTNYKSISGFSTLSSLSIASIDEDSDDDDEGEGSKYYIHHEFGASLAVAESSLERKFLTACCEMWSDPGPPPPLAASGPQLELVLQDVIEKIPLASLWNTSTVEASIPIFSKERIQSSKSNFDIQPKILAKIEQARNLLISPLVARVCVGISHLIFWGILRPRMIAASKLRENFNQSHEIHDLLGLSQEDYHLAESNSPDQLQLVTAIVEEESIIDQMLSKQGLIGLAHTRPLLLLILRASVESYMRQRYPNLFLLEHSLAEFLRRYPHSVKVSTPLTTILLQAAPIHVQLDSLIASLFDPARIGSHVSSLQSGSDTRAKIRTASIEMRRNLMSTSQDQHENGSIETVPLVLFPAKCRNILHTTSAHVRAILSQPQDPQTRKFLSHGMKYIRSSQKMSPKKELSTEQSLEKSVTSFPIDPEGSLRIFGSSAKSSQAALSLLSLKRAAGRYTVSGVPGELLKNGTRRPGTKGGGERLSVLSNLIDSYQHQHQPITAENSLTSVLSGSFVSVGSSQLNNDGFLSDLDTLAMDHSMRLTESLDIDSLAMNSVRARLLSREWPSQDEFATRGRGIVFNNSNSSDSSSNSDIIEASSSSSSSSSSLTETTIQNGTETKEDFISHLLALHHSAKDSPLRNAAHGDDSRQLEIQSEKLLTRNALGLQPEASWIKKARERGPSQSVLRAIEYHEEVIKLEEKKKS
jgi:hypothetical protein